MNNYYNAYMGNWMYLNENELRYKPQITMNKGFFSVLSMIHSCLPHFEQKYFNNNIKLNILYYSHNYGRYPNFNVMGHLLQLNYEPSINKEKIHFNEIGCIFKLSKNLPNPFNSNFKLANEYFTKYLKFNNLIYEKVDNYILKFKDKRILGVHYRGTDKNKVGWVTNISIYEFIKILDYHLKLYKYDIIFISTDEHSFIHTMKRMYDKKYTILFYDSEKNSQNNNSIHLNRLTIITNKIKIIKKNKNNLNNKILLEKDLEKETKYNELLLENVIINSLILSKCDLVLKTHSQVSAYSKIFNPNLNIYRVNACHANLWPESYIPLYDYTNVSDPEIKSLLKNKLRNEYIK